MDFDSRVEPQLSFLGYNPGANDTWRIRYNDVSYGVDFGKHEVFKFVDEERVYEDPEDKFLNNTLQVIKNAMLDTTEDVPEAGNKKLSEPGNENEESSSVESPQDANRQESKHEELTETKDVVIPHKNIVPFTPGIKGIVPQLCECGKIKIGKKGKMITSQRGNQFRPPEKLDHFLVTTTEKDANGDLVTDQPIMDVIGDNCTEIPVMLLYDQSELNFATSLAYYDSAKCKCRGNGESAVNAEGQMVTCDPETCKDAIAKRCKPNGILSVILLDAPRVGGVYKFRTTSWNTIRNILSSMEFIRSLTNGVLAGLPLVMKLQPKTTLIPGTQKTTTIYMVNLEYHGSITDLLSRAQVRAQEREKMQDTITAIEERAKAQLQLPESSEECQDVQEEFYPESIVGGDA